MKYAIVMDFELKYFLEKEEYGFKKITLENCKDYKIPKKDIEFFNKKMKCKVYANNTDKDFKIAFVICRYFDENDFF